MSIKIDSNTNINMNNPKLSNTNTNPNQNSNSYENMNAKFNSNHNPTAKRIKPNPGLNIDSLSNIPKGFKKRKVQNSTHISPHISQNLQSSAFSRNGTTRTQADSIGYKSGIRSSTELRTSNDSFQNMNRAKTSYQNLNTTYASQNQNQTMHNMNMNMNNRSYGSRASSSPYMNRRAKPIISGNSSINGINTSNNNNTNISSPVSNVFKSYRCHKYHTDLDFNYLTNQKFFKDAVSCGKDRLSTTALRSTSPDKYNYESKRESEHNNRYNRTLNTMNSINNINNIHETSLHNDKSSHGILSEILDHQFSINSPSKLKLFQNEMDTIKNEEFKKGILNLASNPTSNANPTPTNKSIYMENPHENKLTVNLTYNGPNPYERFVDSIENVMTYLDPIYESLSLNERIEKFLECCDDPKRGVRLGSIVALYLILRKFQVEDGLKLLILEKTLTLTQNYESQEELFLVACLEIFTLFAPHELLLENLSLITMFITDFNFPRLQKASFNCLMMMEYDGIKTLVDLAGKDYQEYQRYILTNLANTPHIQKVIIMRALLNDVYSNNPEKRHASLAALNRMQDLVGETDALGKLAKFFNESKIEKIFLSSTIRTAGYEGEKILLHEIKNNKDFGVRVAIASVLAYRLPKHPKYLRIQLDNNDTYSLTKNLPGNFCTYYGKVSPYVFENNGEGDNIENNLDNQNQNQDPNNEAFLEVNTRDFLAALQRMLIMNYDHSNPKLIHTGNNFNLLENLSSTFKKLSKNSEIISKYSTYFDLGDNHDSDTELSRNQYSRNYTHKNNDRLLITDEVIKSLCTCLKDYSTAVRDTAAGTLGQIGLPEALIAVDHLVDSIKDEDVNVKSKAIWSIGRISAGCENSVIVSVVEALRSNMWKVKCTCLFALSMFGQRCARLALPLLVKLLKESAINKQAIAETIVKLGNEGESVLLKIMSAENDSNYKLKSSIAKSLGLANVTSSNIDFIVECLFKSANSNNALIRKSSIFSIRVLAEKSEERVTYLKRKNIIPFYYEKMLDKDATIQAVSGVIYVFYGYLYTKLFYFFNILIFVV